MSILIRQLTRSYQEGERRLAVINGLDLQVNQGECLALLGRSGSGKSTLLNLLAGIDRPDGGSIEICGNNLTALTEQARTLFRRRHIGFVYQFFNLLPTLTAAENIALPLELNRVPRSEIRRRVDEKLTLVGLAARADTFPDRLSGGEQQRIAIARALVHRPALVLADEPTGNLDAQTGSRVLQLLTDLAHSGSQTLVLVTHSHEVAAVADRVVVLQEGVLQTEQSGFAW